MNLDVSPDGKEILFDLLGDIYVIPIQGGNASPLLTGRTWDADPRYSPDGTRIVFVSDRSGQMAVWTADRRGGDLKQIRNTERSHLSTPSWTPDGTRILLEWRSGGDAGIRLVDVTTAAIESVGVATGTKGKNPVLSPDSMTLYYAVRDVCSDDSRRADRIVRLDRATGTHSTVNDTNHRAFKPIVSRTGRWLAFIQYPTRKPFPTGGMATLHVRDLTTGVERDLTPIPDADDPCRQGNEDLHARYAFTPDDSAIVIHIGGKIQRVPVTGGLARTIGFRAAVRQEVAMRILPPPMALAEDSIRIRGIRTPVVSPDGRMLIFGALGKLWIQALPDGTPRRLTNSDPLEYSPAISPDGQWLAYIAYTDSLTTLQETDGNAQRRQLAGRVMLISLRNASRGVAPRALTAPGDRRFPLWFPDSRRVLVTQGEKRPEDQPPRPFQWGLQHRFISIDIGTGRSSTHGLVPDGWSDANGSLAADDRFGRRVSPDGTRVYYVDLEQPWNNPGRNPVRLLSAAIEHGDVRTHAVFDGHPWWGSGEDPVVTAAISPDLRYLLINPGGGVGLHLVSLNPSRPGEDTVSFRNGTTRRVSGAPVTGVAWQNTGRVLYATGPRVIRVSTDRAVPQDTIDIALYRPRAYARGVLAIRGARIIRMTETAGPEQVVEVGTLVTRDGKIVAVGDTGCVAIPAEARVINGRGLTLLPGFSDMHQHRALGVSPPPTLDRDDVTDLIYGVTLRYDPGSFGANADQEHSERIRTGATIGPRFFYAGEYLVGAWNNATLESAREITSLLKTLGVTIVKGTDGPRKVRQYWAQATREQGIGITAHTEGLRQGLTNIADGFTAWEHAKFSTPLYRDVLTVIARSGIYLAPTPGVFEGDIGNHQITRYYGPRMLRESPHDTIKLVHFSGMTTEAFRSKPIDLPFDSIYLSRMARSLAILAQAGGHIGVDGHNPPGLLTHWAMWVLADAGLSNLEALRAATRRGAEKVGADRHTGSLEVGKLADFVVLHANPLDDIRNSLKIRYVVLDGFVYDGATLTKLWPTYEPLPRMGWQSEEAYERFPPAPRWPETHRPKSVLRDQ